MFLTAAAGSDALTTALTTVASDMQSTIGSVLPVALGVGGTVLVITIGWKMFRKFTKG